MIMAENKIVTQSKITLSRNVKGYPFPLSSRDNDATNIISSVYEAVSRNGNFDLYRISQISEQKKRSLSARGLITDLLLSSPMGGAIISADKSVSVMVNEEDHVVEQCFVKGFNLDLAYEKLDAIDHLICAKNDICFHEKLGYLTSAPANIGTGMHATVTVFLPALSLTKNIQRCVSAVSSLGITMRATEGDETGYYYELSNQKTLGLTEKEIIDLVKTATSHVEGAEQEARSLLKISSEVEIRDKAMRSLGILKSAYRLTEGETASLASWVKIGASYGWLNADEEKLDELTVKFSDAVMTEECGVDFATPVDRDIYRAEAVKAELN